MSIQAGIRTPGMYTDVNINTQRTGLPANTHKVLFITADDKVMDQPIAIYDEADAIEKAVEKVLEEGYRTGDIYTEGTKKVGTTEMGDLIASRL